MFELPFQLSLVLLLVSIAFFSGIGITTIGPGGIFVTIALYSLTPLTSSQVAGTAHATFIVTGLVGSAAYVYSGEMDTGEGRAIAIILSATSVFGALVGAYVNSFVSRSLFGLLLGGVAMAVGGIVLYRERRGFRPSYDLEPLTRSGRIVLGALGFVLGVCSGLLGIGGPVLAVPALVLVGVPMLLAVAAAQVQSIFIATFAASGYFLQGNVSVPLAVVIGTPLLLGVVIGWRVAHTIDPERLKVVLGVVLLGVGPYLAL
ncbi:sulfite exporter TauE/SafE family protein [Natrinema longum]|uniref:Probable membrane transporter protein n=1 Tax=Natrinema longum TaxID=370324 RepID=A0A8A2U7T4_9EURY|nr:sulfite exporter TauE/SafE family protein [Natrinema longum]MBZ6493951.1 sulfite exporter TauE/SafE family protein [Natrinema longum]QSW84714.1 sulfite exporter TauE/SafE family protein [Natrinema longum]